ncbi:hypothetical protein IU433_03085 [Nocardia puris]|uniref:Small secreted domain DUF320 n=1 Tax=Nocardia puris TaxID=208602 RepID=A0A366DXD5_9NOCA|nr:hypothetical protein [Nocardia puris]MBF6210063.1 hypothetical protein [Nocardia puris]MBF6368254.1 hypothetical protein [Nocardia puris]MBF6458027.1 hypothetical protein [Nocardia puris]RBO94189.1 hypothetical protein DFR74_102612 [Nocardia puris]
MKRSIAAATFAGALALTPAATAHAAPDAGTAPATPVAACVEFPIGAPGGCDIIQNILQLLSMGSSSLSGS